MMQIYAKFSNLVYKILKSRLQNSQISSPLSFRIPLSGIPNGPMLLVTLTGRMLHVILTEQSEWKDLIALGLLPSKKAEWKTAHAIEHAFAAFSIPLFLSNAVVLSEVEGPALSVVPSALIPPRASVERSDGRGRFLDSSSSDLRSE